MKNLAIIAVVVLGCGGKQNGGDNSGLKDYSVTVQLNMEVASCDVALPDDVWVHARLTKGEEHVEHREECAAQGDCSITIKWPTEKGEPERWTVREVTRVGGDPLCDPAGGQECAVGSTCVDTAQKIRDSALGQPMSYDVRCDCQ